MKRLLFALAMLWCLVLTAAFAVEQRAIEVLYEVEHAPHPEPWPTPRTWATSYEVPA